jgi:hypothetical protein
MLLPWKECHGSKQKEEYGIQEFLRKQYLKRYTQEEHPSR